MKEINIINLDQNERTLLPQHYNIGFTHFSSLYYPSDKLDGVISFAGSLVEFKEDILIDKNIPIPLLQELLVVLVNERIAYTLHSEAVDFSTNSHQDSRVLVLDTSEFDFDLYAIYAITLSLDKTKFEEIVNMIPKAFKVRILSELNNNLDVLLNISQDDLNRSIDMLKHHFE